jgi:putative ABC transport system ATP-binding protein
VSQNLLELQNVSFAYSGGHMVFQEINLEIKRNDLIVIQGDSGAGKSTFLKLFNRFYDSTSGRILLHDKELKGFKIDDVRSSIIYLPQLPFVVEGTIEDNLSFPFSFYAHKVKQFDPNKSREWLDYFQVDVPLKHEALKLSIGQRQRIALIRSMLLEPEVLLLDEPGSALDTNNKRLIEQKIESLINSSKITVLMATHSEVSFTGSQYRVFRLEDRRLKEKQ